METNKLHPLEPEQCKQLNRPADNSAFLEGLKKIRDMETNKEIDNLIEQCIAVAGNEAYKGSYAAPREAYGKILAQAEARGAKKAYKHILDLEEMRRKYQFQQDNPLANIGQGQNTEAYANGFNTAITTLRNKLTSLIDSV